MRIAGVAGTVEDFTLRRTTLRDLDGVVHTVPNGEIKVASNLTRVWSRINQDVTVAYGTDIDKAIGRRRRGRSPDGRASRSGGDGSSRRRASSGSRRWASSGSRSRSSARSARPISGPRPASSASACWPPSRPTASRSRGRSASSSRATRTDPRRPTCPAALPPTTSSRPTSDHRARVAAPARRLARMTGHPIEAGGIRERRAVPRLARDREPPGRGPNVPARPRLHGAGQRHGRPLRARPRPTSRPSGRGWRASGSTGSSPSTRRSNGTCRSRSGSPAAS